MYVIPNPLLYPHILIIIFQPVAVVAIDFGTARSGYAFSFVEAPLQIINNQFELEGMIYTFNLLIATQTFLCHLVHIVLYYHTNYYQDTPSSNYYYYSSINFPFLFLLQPQQRKYAPACCSQDKATNLCSVLLGTMLIANCMC